MESDIRKITLGIYELFALRGVRIESGEAESGFCLLSMRLDPEPEATLVVGLFSDEFDEMIAVAREWGRLVHYETLPPDQVEAANSAIFACNHIGLENMSLEGRELIVTIEGHAGDHAAEILEDRVDEETLDRIRASYAASLRRYYERAGLRVPEVLRP